MNTMEHYAQMLLDDEKELCASISEMLWFAYEKGDEEAKEELERIKKVISFEHSVLTCEYLEIKHCYKKTKEFGTYDEYERHMDENGYTYGSPEELGFDTNDGKGYILFDEPAFKVKINGLTENASKEAKTEYRLKKMLLDKE